MAEQKPGYQVQLPWSADATQTDVAAASAPVTWTFENTTPHVAAEHASITFGDAVDVVVATLRDPDELHGWSSQAIRERLALLRRLEGAMTAGVATALSALDHSGGVQSDGAPSKAEWLKANTGRTGREAARMARLADNIGDLPATAAALADGTVGPDAADTIVKATRDGRLGAPDEVEADLLDIAGTTTPDRLRHEVRRRQQAAEGSALLRDERRQHALRRASLVRNASTGMWDLHGRLSDECGTRLRTAIDAFDHPDPAGTPMLERRRPEQRMADALDHVATAVLDHTLAPTKGGITRPHLTVVVDVGTVAADLTRDDAADPGAPNPDAPADRDAADSGTTGTAIPPDHPRWARLSPGETTWGGLLSPQAVRRILCDASVSRVVMAGRSQVLDVGRATRDWSEPQRRAINARDRGCRGPTCSMPISWTQVHHVQWWRHDGPTSVANGIALCHRCHRLVHDVGWTLGFDPQTATATWTSPTGQVTTSTPSRLPTTPSSRAGPGRPTDPSSDDEPPEAVRTRRDTHRHPAAPGASGGGPDARARHEHRP